MPIISLVLLLLVVALIFNLVRPFFPMNSIVSIVLLIILVAAVFGTGDIRINI